MDLVLLEPLAGRQVDDDRAALLLGVQHGRIVRRHVKCGDVPVPHRLPPDSGDGRNSILSGRMVIAIDGPAGAGKSTVARGVALALGFTYLDSGAMYRLVALAALRDGADLDDPGTMRELARRIVIEFGDGRVLLDGEDVTEAIRGPDVSAAASRVSVHAAVREALV